MENSKKTIKNILYFIGSVVLVVASIFFKINKDGFLNQKQADNKKEVIDMAEIDQEESCSPIQHEEDDFLNVGCNGFF